MLPEGCEDPGDGETVTATFELTVECRPPTGTGFSASIGQAPLATGALSDQDGDGVYTTSLPVEKGTEQEVLIERLDPISDDPQAPLVPSTLKDFGTVEFDEDETFEASVSFCDGDGSDSDDGSGNGSGSDNDGGDDSGSGSGSGSVSGDTGAGGSSSGGSGSTSASGSATASGGSSGAKVLPATGGSTLLALGAGALLVGGGLLARRITR